MNMSDAENELFESKLLQSIFRRLCSMACLMSSAYFCHEFRCSPSWEYTMLTFLLVQGSIFFLLECSFFSWGETQSDSTCHRQVMNIRWFCTSHRSKLKPMETSSSLLQVSSSGVSAGTLEHPDTHFTACLSSEEKGIVSQFRFLPLSAPFSPTEAAWTPHAAVWTENSFNKQPRQGERSCFRSRHILLVTTECLKPCSFQSTWGLSCPGGTGAIW